MAAGKEERDEFSHFVTHSGPALFRAAFLLTGSEESSKDLVQAALMKVWLRWRRIRETESAFSYTRQVMLSLYLSWNRRKWTNEIPTVDVPVVSTSADVSVAVLTRHVVLSALASLPKRQRAVVVLRFFDDLTEAQAAEILNCSRGTVKSQTSKALSRLREHPAIKDLKQVPQ